LDLLGAWQAHVIKLEDDIPLPSSERLAWGAYDLIAALTLRDFVEVGMSSLQASIGRRFREVLREIDDQFISYTEKDKLNRLAVLDGRPIEDCGWWWGRIPKAGPAREEVISITGL
jgi:hypothetical protein